MKHQMEINDFSKESNNSKLQKNEYVRKRADCVNHGKLLNEAGD